MRFRRIAAVYLICIALPAASGNTVQEIKQFVESAIERHNPDKEVAEVLRTMKLSERLDPDTVEALQKQGAGPKTVSALKALVAETGNLPQAAAPAAKPANVPLAPPSREEQAKLLADVRDYAANYTGRLPDFICLEQTRRYVDTTGHDSWRPTDVISARLSYFNQHEDYKLISQNDRVITEGDYRSVGGATSTGDFGTTMERIFDPKSHTMIEWKRWATLRRQRMHVFSYRVALEFSDFSIHAGHGERDEKDPAMTVLVGYHGEIFVDQQLGAITRITKEADDIPKSFPIRQASETLDYDYTKIGESEFLLPLSVDVRMQTAREWMKNVKEFRLYRKFSADAVIKFDAEQSTGDKSNEPRPPK
ncbi:MAG: hypothetical protein ABSC93_21710 [Bryobacteraceae bacterium]|jgi:hypothetical protein